MPLVPLALERQGADNFSIGVVSAAWGIGMIATAHRIPAVAARMGAVRLICAGSLLNAAISVAFALYRGRRLVVRAVPAAGAVGSVPWVVSEIWINLVVEENRRGRAVAVYSTLVALGLAAGPLVLQLVGVYGPRALPAERRARPAGHPAAAAHWAAGAADPADGTRRLRAGLRPGARRPAGRAGQRAGRAGRLQLPADLRPRGRRGGRDRRHVAVGLRHRQPRPAMADRLDGRSFRPARRARRLRALRARFWWPGDPARSARLRHSGRAAAVGRHLLRHLHGRAGAARPALPGRRHRARQCRLHHGLHRWAAWSAGRSPVAAMDAVGVPASASRWPSSMPSPRRPRCWRSTAAADKSGGS